MQFDLQGLRAYDAGSPGQAEDARIQTNEAVQRRPRTRPVPPVLSRDRSRGQSVAEFALVIPILLVLFVALADFGRIFAAGVSVEAATRDAAEATANEYLSNPPGGDLSVPAPASNQSYYDKLHAYAAKVVCGELRGLPNTNYDAGSQTCPDMPLVMVCVHDGADAGCGSQASPGGGIPADCGDFTPPPTSAQVTSPDGLFLTRSVEVRTCYHFTNLLRMPLFSFGDLWLQRSRTFTVPCYFALGTDDCG
jgi:hypothetical protein